MPQYAELIPKERALDRTVQALEAELTPPFREQLVTLRDGRKLAMAEFGDPDGKVVLWFHGTPGARRQLPPAAAELAAQQGVRLIGVDRPGVGDSTPHTEHTLLSWAEDIRELVNHLRVERFGLAGISGGGPHVLAVAHALKERVTAAALLGGVAPLVGADAPTSVPSYLPGVMRMLHAYRSPLGDTMTRLLRAMPARAAYQAFPAIMRVLPKEDRAVLNTPKMRAMFITDIFRGSRESFRAQVQDMSAYGRDWGFSVRELDVPTRLWHGKQDQMVPYSHAQHLASLIPGAELTAFEGEGHFAGFMRPAEVLGWLRERG